MHFLFLFHKRIRNDHTGEHYSGRIKGGVMKDERVPRPGIIIFMR